VDKFEELLSDYLDGTLDAQGKQELARMVEADPERLRELVDLVRENSILQAELGDPVGGEFTRGVIADLEKDKTRFVRSVMTDIRSSSPGGKRPSRRVRRSFEPRGGTGLSWMMWGLAAAGAVIGVGILVITWGGGKDEVRDLHPQARSDKRKPQATPPGNQEEPGEAKKSPELPTPPNMDSKSRAPEAPVARKVEEGPKRAPDPSAPAPERAPKVDRPETPPAPPEKPSPEKSTVVEATAVLERWEGKVTVGQVEPKVGQALLSGFDLETADDQSVAVVRYLDGTRIEVRGSSRLQDLGDGAGRRVFVTGVIASQIAPQPKDRPMIFVTPHGEAKVLGTSLRLVVDPDPKKGTRLEVEEGKVEFKNLAGKTVLVESGHYAVAALNLTLVSRLARVTTGLVALYTFKEGRGGVIHDVSSTGTPIDLKIQDEKAVRWSSKGLLLGAPTLAASAAPATRIIQACKASNEVTFEAWIRPATLAPGAKDGRILTLSADFTNQNFMLGQDGVEGPARSYFARLRTTLTDSVGKPILASQEGKVAPKLTHLLYSRTAQGTAVFYVDGAEDSRAAGGGALSAWDDGYRFGLGNEFTNNRPWLGEYHLVAVYSRALSADDVRQNHKAGAE
jgi:hypothetical protein